MPYKPTFLQKLKSYIVPQSLAVKSSAYNEILEVLLVAGKIQLNSRTACYSYEDKYESFGYAFQQIQLGKFAIENVLVLGGGLCSVPQLVQQYHKKAIFDIVEIDEIVIELAKEFAPLKVTQSCTFYKEDAFSFVAKNKKKHHLICVDVFINELVPEQFMQKAFLLFLEQSIAKNGLILMSVLPSASGLSSDFVDLAKYFKQVFSEVEQLKVGENVVFMGKGS